MWEVLDNSWWRTVDCWTRRRAGRRAVWRGRHVPATCTAAAPVPPQRYSEYWADIASLRPVRLQVCELSVWMQVMRRAGLFGSRYLSCSPCHSQRVLLLIAVTEPLFVLAGSWHCVVHELKPYVWRSVVPLWAQPVTNCISCASLHSCNSGEK